MRMMRAMLVLVILILHRILIVHVVPRAVLDEWAVMGADFGCLGLVLLAMEGWKR